MRGYPWNSASFGECPHAPLPGQLCHLPGNTLQCPAQCQLQQEGPGSTAGSLPPASQSMHLAGGLSCAFQGQPNQHKPSPLPKRGGPAPCPIPLGHEPCPFLWQFWHHWSLLRQFNFLICQKSFFFFFLPPPSCQVLLYAGLVSYVMKGSSHPQSWLGENCARSPARGDQLLPAPAKVLFRHQRTLTKKYVFFLSLSQMHLSG